MKNKKLRIRSIEYEYDDNASKQWFDLWVNTVKKSFLKEFDTRAKRNLS